MPTAKIFFSNFFAVFLAKAKLSKGTRCFERKHKQQDGANYYNSDNRFSVFKFTIYLEKKTTAEKTVEFNYHIRFSVNHIECIYIQFILVLRIGVKHFFRLFIFFIRFFVMLFVWSWCTHTLLSLIGSYHFIQMISLFFCNSILQTHLMQRQTLQGILTLFSRLQTRFLSAQ